MLQKPASGGIPAVERKAKTDVAPVTGIFAAMPPSLFMSLVPACPSTAEELTKSSPLKTAWLKRWKTAPAMPSDVPVDRPNIM